MATVNVQLMEKAVETAKPKVTKHAKSEDRSLAFCMRFRIDGQEKTFFSIENPEMSNYSDCSSLQSQLESQVSRKMDGDMSLCGSENMACYITGSTRIIAACAFSKTETGSILIDRDASSAALRKAIAVIGR